MVPLLHETWPEELRQRMRIALRQADAVVANTSIEAGNLRNGYGVPAEKVFVGSLGVDLPRGGAVQNRKRQVLFLGRKVPEKGIQSLIHAMGLVWKTCPESELILAGARVPGTAEVDAMIESLPEGERGRVISLDNISEEKKTELLAACSCLVLPSANESFGIVLLEAMAHYKPVIALDCPVFHDVVDDSVDGLLVAAGSLRQMANAILRLLENPAVARAMGERGHAKIQERFTWGHMADNYLRAYDYAINAHSGPGMAVSRVAVA
jgi:glycosyltransferase involved in cell wall biosynthesis